MQKTFIVLFISAVQFFMLNAQYYNKETLFSEYDYGKARYMLKKSFETDPDYSESIFQRHGLTPESLEYFVVPVCMFNDGIRRYEYDDSLLNYVIFDSLAYRAFIMYKNQYWGAAWGRYDPEKSNYRLFISIYPTPVDSIAYFIKTMFIIDGFYQAVFFFENNGDLKVCENVTNEIMSPKEYFIKYDMKEYIRNLAD